MNPISLCLLAYAEAGGRRFKRAGTPCDRAVRASGPNLPEVVRTLAAPVGRLAGQSGSVAVVVPANQLYGDAQALEGIAIL